MRKTPRRKRRSFIAMIVLLALLATVPVYMSSYTVILITNILMYVVLALSWTIFSGPTGYISLASAAFFGTGVYASALLSSDLPLPVVIVIGGIASFVLAFLVGALTLRLKGMYFTMFTFGLVELVRNSLHWWEVNMTGTVGRLIISADNMTIFYCMVGIFVAVLIVSYLIKRSRFGLALESIGESEEAAAHSGVNVTRVKSITFAVSAFFMGAAGATMCMRWTYIDPTTAFSIQYSFMPVLMAIFGGMGHLYAPITGATVFSILEELLTTKFPYYYMLIFGLIMLAVILFMPHGLEGVIEKGRKRAMRRSAVET
ncbi:MAG: branched-chain amino acid ABC transporter permease [Deltaproteobacteria bacterium HGW-Deltaproteobacteria-21]|jgi:branched-chain amino acid transport system permease protein|nr:MAG: branched-chain amino acid ABC transporter permease [Deltaproteobacteria bacterium HGW-Deltaproteobacteria-21]